MHRIVPLARREDVSEGVPVDAPVVRPVDASAVVVLLREHIVVKLHGVRHVAVQNKEWRVQRAATHWAVVAGELGHPRFGSACRTADDCLARSSEFPVVRGSLDCGVQG